MKRCPACRRVYDDVSLRFCLDDGTELVNKPLETPAPPTLAMPAPHENQPTINAFQPPPPPPPPAATVSAFKSKRQRNVIVWILILALGLPFIAGIVLGGWSVINKRKLTWHLVLEVDPKTPDRSAAVRQTINVIDSRLDALGLANYEVRAEGDTANGRIVVNLPATDDPERVKQIITTWGKLELVHVISPPSPAAVQTFATREEAAASFASSDGAEHTHRVLPYSDREEVNTSAAAKWVVVKSPPIVTGTDLRTAAAVADRGGGIENYLISFSLKPDGAAKFGAWTGANINEYLGVVLNDEVKSIAYIKSQIFDQGEITGRFTRQSAEDLALVLRAGALPVPVKLVEETVNK
jgi:protein-export membrane protein SecD